MTVLFMIYDIVVIGAGAAGLMAALKASQNDKSVVILEGNEKAGKKLLATGNGRCNIANENIKDEFFHGDKSVITSVSSDISIKKVLAEFSKIGIFTVSDSSGRLYPKSFQASSVLKALSDTLSEKSVDILTSFPVFSVIKSGRVFILKSTDGREIKGEKVILACGGKASSKLSCKEGGYGIAKQLGHTVTCIKPALTKFMSSDKFIKNMSGIRAKCEAKLICDAEEVYKECGEIIFSDNYLSGICLFNLSNYAQPLFDKGKKLNLRFNFIHTETNDDLNRNISLMIKNRPNMKCGDLLNGYLNMKLGLRIIKKCKIDSMAPISTLNSEKISKIINTTSSLDVSVSGLSDFENAQITSGGIPLVEVNPITMESNICSSLYFAGEILNIHGNCGGYNLYWAWASAIIAGEAANGKVIKI